ncbi:UDP-4-amino-4-deoxy-L-arabinose--oxoglutarate aminotransferase [subsurface metagenome]
MRKQWKIYLIIGEKGYEKNPRCEFKIGEEEKRAVNEVLDSRRISEGAKVGEFEKTFAKYIRTKYAVAVSSGTAALMAGMAAMVHNEDINVKHGTKVITTPVTYVATSNALVTTRFDTEEDVCPRILRHF